VASANFSSGFLTWIVDSADYNISQILETTDFSEIEVVLSTSVIDEEVLETDVKLRVGTTERSLSEMHIGLSTSVVHITLGDIDLGEIGEILESRDFTKVEVVLSSSVVNEAHVLEEADVELGVGTGEGSLGKVHIGLSTSVVHITLGNVDKCIGIEVLNPAVDVKMRSWTSTVRLPALAPIEGRMEDVADAQHGMEFKMMNWSFAIPSPVAFWSAYLRRWPA